MSILVHVWYLKYLSQLDNINS